MIVKILHQYCQLRVRVFWLVAVIIIANNGDGGRLAVLKPIKQDSDTYHFVHVRQGRQLEILVDEKGALQVLRITVHH